MKTWRSDVSSVDIWSRLLDQGSRKRTKTEILLGRESSIMADQLRLLSKYIFNRRDNGNMAMQTEMTRFLKTVVFKTVVL